MIAPPGEGGWTPRWPVFDAHFHVIDPRFPLVANDGYRPEPFTVEGYRSAVDGLGVEGGAVVSASFQGYDQSYLLDALDRLGRGFVGVTQLVPAAHDDAIELLAERGVRALRLNLHRGAGDPREGFDRLARRAFEVAGWHAEVYADLAAVDQLGPWLASLPKLVVDHLGLSRAGLGRLLELVARGAGVKASGFGRGDIDVPETLRAVARENPGALVFGTDLPSTRAPRPFSPADALTVVEALGDELGRRALWDNARRLYGLPLAE